MSKWKANFTKSFDRRLATLREAVGWNKLHWTARWGSLSAWHLLGAGGHTATVRQRRLAKLEGDIRLRRRMLAIAALDADMKPQVPQLIDAFIESGQLRIKVSAGR